MRWGVDRFRYGTDGGCFCCATKGCTKQTPANIRSDEKYRREFAHIIWMLTSRTYVMRWVEALLVSVARSHYGSSVAPRSPQPAQFRTSNRGTKHPHAIPPHLQCGR